MWLNIESVSITLYKFLDYSLNTHSISTHQIYSVVNTQDKFHEFRVLTLTYGKSHKRSDVQNKGMILTIDNADHSSKA